MRLLLIILPVILIFSCSRKAYWFSSEDFNWVPYKRTDTLIFSSNTGDTDTFFLKQGQNYTGTEPMGNYRVAAPDRLEMFYINYYFSNDTIKRFGEYPGETIISMQKTRKNETQIKFSIKTNDAYFGGAPFFDSKELNETKLTHLQTNLKFYNDILIVERDTAYRQYLQPDHYILRLYWSKSEGLVRFDKNDTVYYTLTKQYSR